MKKNILLMALILVLLNVSISFAETETAERQYNPYKYLPDTLYYCGFNSCDYVRTGIGYDRRIYQRYDFSDVNETIKHAYVSVRKTTTQGLSMDVEGRYFDDGIWSSMTWNNMGSMVSGGSTYLFGKQPQIFPLNTYENQVYDLAPLINGDADKIFTIQYKWEVEGSDLVYDFRMSAYIDYEILDPNCTRDWTCTNYTLCQETQIKECNQVFDNNDCGFEYDGDYSEFGYPSCCYEDWSPQYASCELNNTQIKYYTDDNVCNSTEQLPFDNNTEVACDYCSPDLEFIEEQCIWNGSSYFTYTSWQDNDYYSCCVITGEEEDCIADTSPYNESNTSMCVDKIEQFELQIDENVFLTPYERDDKVYATIWLNDTTEVYTCQSYVKTLDGYGIKDKRVIQINPVYEAKEKSLISLDTRTYEDREFFTTNKGQATIYYTKENIVVDGRPYLFGVECVGNVTGERLISEKVAYISYSNINEPVTLMFWINENIWAIVIVFIGLIFLVIIIALGFKHLGISK